MAVPTEAVSLSLLCCTSAEEEPLPFGLLDAPAGTSAQSLLELACAKCGSLAVGASRLWLRNGPSSSWEVLSAAAWDAAEVDDTGSLELLVESKPGGDAGAHWPLDDGDATDAATDAATAGHAGEDNDHLGGVGSAGPGGADGFGELAGAAHATLGAPTPRRTSESTGEAVFGRPPLLQKAELSLFRRAKRSFSYTAEEGAATLAALKTQRRASIKALKAHTNRSSIAERGEREGEEEEEEEEEKEEEEEESAATATTTTAAAAAAAAALAVAENDSGGDDDDDDDDDKVLAAAVDEEAEYELSTFAGFVDWGIEMREEDGAWHGGRATRFDAGSNTLFVGGFAHAPGLEGEVELDFEFLRPVACHSGDRGAERRFGVMMARLARFDGEALRKAEKEVAAAAKAAAEEEAAAKASDGAAAEEKEHKVEALLAGGALQFAAEEGKKKKDELEQEQQEAVAAGNGERDGGGGGGGGGQRRPGGGGEGAQG
jgi:hypothetical protein